MNSHATSNGVFLLILNSILLFAVAGAAGEPKKERAEIVADLRGASDKQLGDRLHKLLISDDVNGLTYFRDKPDYERPQLAIRLAGMLNGKDLRGLLAQKKSLMLTGRYAMFP